MNRFLAIPDDTIGRQRTAASPAHSAWVSANAGSGKTEILVQRVVRLLLDGAAPSSILCLTFTKAAAAEMTNRVFRRLSSWIALTDAELSKSIERLTGQTPSDAIMLRARRLFAEALETPGGLKVQTIHAFCERLLHLFPFDANVPSNFTVLDEGGSAEIHQSVMAELLSEFSNRSGTDGGILEVIARAVSLDALHDLVREALKNDSLLAQWSQGSGQLSYTDDLRRIAGIATGVSENDLIRDFFARPFWQHDARGAIAVLANSDKATNKKTAAALDRIIAVPAGQRPLELLQELLLTKAGAPRAESSLITDKMRQQAPDISAAFNTMVADFEVLQDRLATILAIKRSCAAMQFLAAYIVRHLERKAARGALDFDDLIRKTHALLHRNDISPWILYKLDYGLSHVLVDEAQDTSPAQWDIIKKLSEEFTVGDTASTKNRTVFAVGDEKQSIYGFQGADPASFGKTKRELQRRHMDAGRGFKDVRLVLSFRSSREVLSAVDQVFSQPGNTEGLVIDDAVRTVVHESLHKDKAGFVELWPQEKGVAVDDLTDPWSATAMDDEAVVANAALAQRIALYIGHLVAHGDCTGRLVRAGDVMILVRHRGPLFETIIQALKFNGVAVAGADRLKLNAHIAVKDLLALGRFCIVPSDDLNFACLLKSPLGGLDDNDLLQFAPLRSGSLIDAFCAYVAKTGEYSDLQSRLQHWRSAARETGPFRFYSRILEAEGGRRAMLQRLGPEAIDAINEFLSRSLEFETRRHASLAAFLLEFEGRDIEIKRDFAHAGDEVRVMTVHAAKGLEAPIVILPDTIEPPKLHKKQLVQVDTADGRTLPFWCAPGAREPALVRAARAAEKQAADDEYRRLLYVAMTRAENGVVICGARKNDAKPGCWYDMISTALRAGPAADARDAGAQLVSVAGFDDQPVERWLIERAQPADANGADIAGANGDMAHAQSSIEKVPEWLFTAAPPPTARQATLAPSSAADGPEAMSDSPAAQQSRQHGRFLHALIEQLPLLPEDQWPPMASRVARRFGADIDPAGAIADLRNLLTRPDLSPLFSPQAKAEVALTGTIGMADGKYQPVWGVVDRLWVGDNAVMAADFKTGANPPPHAAATPKAIVVQLALYRAMLRQIFPDKSIRCLVIWTAGPVVHDLSDQQMDMALSQIGQAAGAP